MEIDLGLMSYFLYMGQGQGMEISPQETESREKSPQELKSQMKSVERRLFLSP